MNQQQDNPRQAALTAYAAGLIDGEGTVRIAKMKPAAKSKSKHPHYHTLVAVGMVTPAPLHALRNHFGIGSIREERVPGARSLWRWTINAQAEVKKLLQTIRPHLLVKHEQADLAIWFMDRKSAPFNRKLGLSDEEIRLREEAYQKMRKLNAVGAAATTK